MTRQTTDLHRAPAAPRRVRFGVFEFDPRTGVLSREGDRVTLRPQQARALALLISRRGRLVTREDLRDHLWDRQTFVSFETSLNTCIRRLRAVLGEEADEPRYVQTVPGRGYRFIAPVEEQSDPEPARGGRFRSSLGGLRWPGRAGRFAALAGLALVVTLLSWLAPRWLAAPTAADEAPVVLLGRFEDGTGDELLAASLETGLRIGLQQVASLQLMPPTEVADVLSLMKREQDTVVDRRVGLEICRRAGAAALVVGGLNRVGERYSLHAEAIEAASGRTLFAASANAADRHALLPALDELTRRVRQGLGESLEIALPDRLPLVTTSELAALEAYTQALDLRPEDPARVVLLQRALEIDPEFAMAHAQLGVASIVQGEPGRARRHLRAAAAAPARLTEYETLYVDGHLAALDGDGDEAIRIWSLMAEVFPRMPTGPVNLSAALVYYRNDFDGCAAALARVPPPTPSGGSRPYVVTNRTHCLMGAGRLEEALGMALDEAARDSDLSTDLSVLPLIALRRHRRAEEILTAGATDPARGRVPDPALPALYADRKEYRRAAAAAARTARQGQGPTRLASRVAVAAYLDATGMLPELRAEIAAAAGETMALAGAADVSLAPTLSLFGVLAARNGDAELARAFRDEVLRLLDGASNPLRWRPHLELLEAELMARRGRPAEAAAQLRAVLEESPAYPLHARAGLARWYEAAGDPAAATEEYRFLARQRGRALAECLDGVFCVDLPLNVLAVVEAEDRVGASLPGDATADARRDELEWPAG